MHSLVSIIEESVARLPVLTTVKPYISSDQALHFTNRLNGLNGSTA